eukprot:TRINITY_DN63813_c0_g1_i1.p1 TRINITY_DN63813_c0_g1~~TRINITY_DN63813_c0_g1_i1.p1  ORF type:complete len:651 (+),score=106.19 TRINITY_DN63813_c0_g1_i1:57-2009(+)
MRLGQRRRCDDTFFVCQFLLATVALRLALADSDNVTHSSSNGSSVSDSREIQKSTARFGYESDGGGRGRGHGSGHERHDGGTDGGANIQDGQREDADHDDRSDSGTGNGGADDYTCGNPLFRDAVGKTDDGSRHPAAADLQWRPGMRLCPQFNDRSSSCCGRTLESEVLMPAFEAWRHWLGGTLGALGGAERDLQGASQKTQDDQEERRRFALLVDLLADLRKAELPDCFTALLEYLAGMLCFACRADWRHFGVFIGPAAPVANSNVTAAGHHRRPHSYVLNGSKNFTNSSSIAGSNDVEAAGRWTSHDLRPADGVGRGSAAKDERTKIGPGDGKARSVNRFHGSRSNATRVALADAPAVGIAAAATKDAASVAPVVQVVSVLDAAPEDVAQPAPGEGRRLIDNVADSRFVVRVNDADADAIWARCEDFGGRAAAALQALDDTNTSASRALSTTGFTSLKRRLEMFQSKERLQQALYSSIARHRVGGVNRSPLSDQEDEAASRHAAEAYAPIGEGRRSGFALRWPSGEESLGWAQAPWPLEVMEKSVSKVLFGDSTGGVTNVGDPADVGANAQDAPIKRIPDLLPLALVVGAPMVVMLYLAICSTRGVRPGSCSMVEHTSRELFLESNDDRRIHAYDMDAAETISMSDSD